MGIEKVKVVIEARFNEKVANDLGLLLKSGYFGETAAEVVESIVNRYLFDLEADGTLDRLREE